MPVRADRAVLNSAATGPQAWPLIPEIPMYASVSTPVRSSTLPQNLSHDILAAKARVAELREKIVSAPVNEPSNADLMTVILGMREQMALKEDIHVVKFETFHELRAELDPICAHIAEVDAKASQSLYETQVLNDQVKIAEEATRRDSAQMVQLKSALRNLEARLTAGGFTLSETSSIQLFSAFALSAGQPTYRAAPSEQLSKTSSSSIVETRSPFTFVISGRRQASHILERPWR